jgi:hypothetical protein
MRLVIATTLAAAAVLSAAPASADPSAGCSGLNDPRLCNPSKVYYCPDTGQFGSWLSYCPSLVQGPYEPGGRTPEGGLAQ